MNQSTTLSPLDLKEALDQGKVDFIFDLRNPDEYEAWRVEGHNPIPSLNIPQPDFVGEEEKYLGRLPRGKRIVTICAHGDSSKYSADYLRERGYEASSLAGGMDAWSELYVPKRVSRSPLVFQINRVARGCLAYLIIGGTEAVVIDTSRHLDTVRGLVREQGARISHVIDTHIHADHISGGRALAEESGAPYHLNPADATGVPYVFSPLRDGEEFSIGSHRLRVIHSPGHTPGSTSLLLDDGMLFTGDTIMKTSIGRPDLGGEARAWGATLYETLFNRLAGLSDHTLILPSHSVPAVAEDEEGLVRISLGEVRAGLDLFQYRDRDEFLRQVENSLPENPERYQEIRKVNLGLIHPDEDKQKELEIGKNLCGMEKAA